MTINQEQFEQYFVNMSIENFGKMNDFARNEFLLSKGGNRFKKQIFGGKLKTLFINGGQLNRTESELERDLSIVGIRFSNLAEKEKFFNYLDNGPHLRYGGEHDLEFKKVSDCGEREYLISYLNSSYVKPICKSKDIMSGFS